MHYRPNFDVLVIGAGVAGLYAALSLPKTLQVGLITKEDLALSASQWAQGGMAAVIADDDSYDLHIADTLKAGVGLCDPSAVRFLVERSPACVAALIDLGIDFDQVDGNLALTLEAAHSRRRVLHAADATGRAIVDCLRLAVTQSSNITVLHQAFVVDLWMAPDQSWCQGVAVVLADQLVWLTAQVVIIATGGGGQLYAQTTNPAVSTGDGVAIAWRAGAHLRDLEFMQFHPTALLHPPAPRFLISEAVRGEGGILVDHNGHRFAFDYHADGELAPRDVVSRAIFSHLQQTHRSHVWLSLRNIPESQIRHRFPNILQVCAQWGVDAFGSGIPVSPAAHYWMGGIKTQLTQTSIPNLHAVGEAASTGVHGANRLASNSLLECLVFGAEFAHLNLQPRAVSQSFSLGTNPISITLNVSEIRQLQDWRSQLPELLWQSAGISRSHTQLVNAIAQVGAWRKAFSALKVSQAIYQAQADHQKAIIQPTLEQMPPTINGWQLWGETRNLLDLAFLLLKSAIWRTESRGGHFRSDYPITDPDWQFHSIVQRDQIWPEIPG